MSAITLFLEGRGTDHRGRIFADVIALEDEQLESIHDYIQWLFPLPEASAFNPLAPVLSSSDIEALRLAPIAKQNLERAGTRMLLFYKRTTHWLTAMDHNHLRITRIIRCLALILGPAPAQRFHREILALVERAGGPVASQAMDYWRSAAFSEAST
ncbi:MAG TPA: opioid growth factor receptor-related protein [Aestuariivirgaceae bacterium]|jgi:hypothetical protein